MEEVLRFAITTWTLEGVRRPEVKQTPEDDGFSIEGYCPAAKNGRTSEVTVR